MLQLWVRLRMMITNPTHSLPKSYSCLGWEALDLLHISQKDWLSEWLNPSQTLSLVRVPVWLLKIASQTNLNPIKLNQTWLISLLSSIYPPPVWTMPAIQSELMKIAMRDSILGGFWETRPLRWEFLFGVRGLGWLVECVRCVSDLLAVARAQHWVPTILPLTTFLFLPRQLLGWH